MKIHEYQGKELLKRYGVRVPRGIPCFSVDEALKAAEALGGKVWVVKAQIHAGGRGKGGGVKVAKSLAEVKDFAGRILGMQLVTHQTTPAALSWICGTLWILGSGSAQSSHLAIHQSTERSPPHAPLTGCRTHLPGTIRHP
jgi:hypothetical protein